MSIRSRSRELTLQLLFEKEFQSQGSTSGPSQELIDHAQKLLSEHSLERTRLSSNDISAYALILFDGINENLAAIDQLISAQSQNWKITRMPIVDRNILRIATFELMFMENEVPAVAVIDEAIEMAKKFGSTDSQSFVNGVLDQIGRNLNKIGVDENKRNSSLKSS
jgi:N utilization substance protein B